MHGASICRNDDDIFGLRSPGCALCDGAEVRSFCSGLELELKKGYRLCAGSPGKEV